MWVRDSALRLEGVSHNGMFLPPLPHREEVGADRHPVFILVLIY